MLVSAAKFHRAGAAVTPKESRKISRILEAEFACDAAHRACGVYQATPGLQRQALLNQIKGRGAGQTAAQSIQAGFGQREMPCVALHRPMFEVLRFDQVAKAAQPLRVATAVDFGTA